LIERLLSQFTSIFISICTASQNNNLKTLIDKIEVQKSHKESELKALSETLLNERQLWLTQLEESESRRESLQLEVDGLKTSNGIILSELSSASAEIEVLSKHKEFVHQLSPILQSIKQDVHKSKVDIIDLTQLLPPFMVGFDDWKHRVAALHKSELLRLNDSAQVLRDHVDTQKSVVERHEAALIGAEVKIKIMEEMAHSNSIAWRGERLSWEKAMEDLKMQHKKEFSRLCCKAMDEADILGNEIAELQNTIKTQKEGHDYKCKNMLSDWQRKVDDRDAVISRIKYESALEMQGLTLKLDQLNCTLASKDKEINSLADEISSMNERHITCEHDHQVAFEALSRTHQSKLEEMERIYEERLCRSNRELQQNEREKDQACAAFQQHVAESKARIASVHFKTIRDVATIKSQLGALRGMTVHHIARIQKEWEYNCNSVLLRKLKSMQRKYDAIVERMENEMAQLLESHTKEEVTLREQLTSSKKETMDAKAMLFINIRENKKSLECALRQQKKQHKLDIEALSNKSIASDNEVAVQLDKLSKEYESLAKENAKRDDAILAKDKEIAQATEQVRYLGQFSRNLFMPVQVNAQISTPSYADIQSSLVT
jgi:hypothetical protein